jgi:hypothetical protein
MSANPVVGQKLFMVYSQNRTPKMADVIVKSVGRKYFSVWMDGVAWSETKFHLGSWTQKTQYSPDHALYLSRQEYEESKERVELIRQISEYFRYGSGAKISLDDLRMIASKI